MHGSETVFSGERGEVVLYMIGKCGLPQLRQIEAELGNVGMILAPQAWQKPTCIYACDNGVYGAFEKSVDGKRSEAEHCYYRSFWWDVEGDNNWRGMLAKIESDNPPLWVLLPDRVTDWPKTVELARLYLPEVRQRNFPVAIALQDGCDFEEVLDFNPEWVFVAGSDDWKEQNIATASRFFKPLGIGVHVGRCNTGRRIHLAWGAGADSCDGTTLNKFRDATLPLISRTMAQPCMAMV